MALCGNPSKTNLSSPTDLEEDGTVRGRPLPREPEIEPDIRPPHPCEPLDDCPPRPRESLEELVLFQAVVDVCDTYSKYVLSRLGESVFLCHLVTTVKGAGLSSRSGCNMSQRLSLTCLVIPISFSSSNYE